MNRAYAPEHASALNEHNCICWTMRKRGGFFVQNGGMDAFLIMDAFLSGAPFAHYHPENSTGAETPDIRPFSHTILGTERHKLSPSCMGRTLIMIDTTARCAV